MTHMANIAEPLAVHANGQDWLASWHPPHLPAPDGKRHGSSGLCVTTEALVVLVSLDGKLWGLPAGRSEGDEDWRATLDREVLEEACATVVEATLLGYTRGQCTKGPEEGLVLVRSHWRANVVVHDWRPQYEIGHRLLLRPDEALARMSRDPNLAFIRRIFHGAGFI